MAWEMVRSSQSSQIPNPLGSISILVVDDDTTCLSIVSAILKSWKYEVVTVKHASDALCTLRIKGGSFDLVITDVHMPDMNGFELQKQIDEEFKLPVVFMSADGKDSVILRGLQSGAVFFIVKPISPEDLKHLWQYAVAKKKITKPTIEEITYGSDQLFQQTSQAFEASDNGDTAVGDEDSNEERRRRSSRDSKENKSLAKDNINGGNGENREGAATQKRTKVVWTNALHSQFLEAIQSLGLERAVPKKILEYMNVPGLTRENVASHLQKYRIFLKRVSEASSKLQSSASERCMIERTLRSTFASRQPPNPMMFNPRIFQLPPLQQQRQFGNNNYQLPPGAVHLKPPNFNQEAPNSSINNYHPPLGSAQSTLLCNQAGYHSLQNPMMSMANPSYQIYHHPTFGLVNCGGTNLIQQQPLEALNNGLMLKSSYGNMATFMNNSNSNEVINNVGGGDDQLNWLFAPVPYSTGFETPTFADNNAIREKNIAVPIISDESDHMISPTSFADTNGVQEQSGLSSEARGSADHDFVFGDLFDKVNSIVVSAGSDDNNSDDLKQPYGDGDLGFDFMNQINVQSPTQQDGNEATSSASSTTTPYHDHTEDNHQSLDQQPGDEVMVSNFGITRSPSDDYFPSFEPNTTQHDDEDFLESLFGSLGGNGKPGDSAQSNQGKASIL